MTQDANQKLAERTAARLEEEQGIPKDITLDRLYDTPGWKEREIEYMAGKTGTDKSQVDKWKSEGEEGGSQEERTAASLAFTRSKLIQKERGVGEFKPEASVATVETAAGTKKEITRSQAARLQSKNAREAFREAVAVGIIPTGSVFIPGESGKYQYISQVEADRLKKQSPVLYRTLTEKGGAAYEKAVKVTEWSYKKADKNFRRVNAELREGEFVLKSELARIKKEAPEAYQVYITKGLDAGNKFIDDFNKSVTAQVKKEKSNITLAQTQSEAARAKIGTVLFGDLNRPGNQAAKIKEIYRMLTPWAEEAGETFLTHIKGTPGRLKETASAMATARAQPPRTQEDLKAEYTSYQRQPLWAKMLFPVEIVYDPKHKKYTEYVAGEVPFIGGAKKKALELAEKVTKKAIKAQAKKKAVEELKKQAVTAAKNKQPLPTKKDLTERARQIERQLEEKVKQADSKSKVRTLGAEDVGMSKSEFAKFLQERVRNPSLTPEVFKRREALKTNIDWAEIDRMIRVGKIKTAAEAAAKAKKARAAATLAESRRRLEQIKRATKAAEAAQAAKKEAEAVKAAATLKKLARTPGVRDKRVADINKEIREFFAKKRAATQSKAKAAIVPTTKQRQQESQQESQKESQQESQKEDLVSLTQTQQKQRQMEQIATELAVAVATQTKPAEATATETQEKIRSLIKEALQEMPVPTPVGQEKAKTKAIVSLSPVSPVSVGLITPPKGTTPPRVPPTTPIKPTGTPFGPPRKPPEGPPEKGKTPFRPGLPANATDKEKRSFIKKATGAVGWVQGRFHRKPVNHIVTEPYSQATHIVLLGKVPSNVEMKPNIREAYKTITQIRGSGPSQPIKLEGGIADPVIYKRDGKLSISFTPDKPRRSRGATHKDIGPGIVETRSRRGRVRRARP